MANKPLPKKYLLPWEPPTHGCLPKWRKTIDMAEEREGFTAAEENKAWDWKQCAGGEAYHKFDGLVTTTGYITHGPDDSMLERLGCRFADAVGSDSFKTARTIIDRIENRLIELDKKIRSQHKKLVARYKKTGDLTELREFISKYW